MKDIIVIGASGLGKEMKTILDAINKEKKIWNLIGFIDDGIDRDTLIMDGFKCIGSIEQAIAGVTKNTAMVFGIADRTIVKNIYDKLKQHDNFSFPNIIHPTVEITSGLKMGIGNVLTFGSILSCDVKIGNFNFFNNFTAVGHDSSIGDNNCFMPRVQISGNVNIEDHNFFGMSSALLQNKKIGSRNIINAYTFLSKSIGDDRKYFGIPGRRIKI